MSATTITEILPPRGYASIDSSNRGLVRKWLTARGMTYAEVANLTVAQLSAAYNDGTDGEFYALAARQPQPVKCSPTPPADQATALSAMSAAMAALMAANAPATAPLDEQRVIDLIAEHAPTAAEPTEIRVTVAGRSSVTMPRQHYAFGLLLATVAAHVPAYLVGPAGTGKTTAAHRVATALGLDFAAISVGPMTSKSDLFGMRDAHGNYHESDLVRIATTGGVFLFDEFDAGNAGTLTACNMLLANGSFATPTGMREKHADFVPIFGLNTYGTGASREYVGRNQLDAATLDRGAFLDWPLDEGLEAHFVGVSQTSPRLDIAAGGVPTAAEWLETVQRTRRAVAAAGLRHIISPRATLYGAAMAAAGIGRKHLSACLLIKGLDAASAAKITNN